MSAIVIASMGVVGAGGVLPTHFTALNDSGRAVTILDSRPVSANHPFFRGLGTNRRTCATCHVPADGWSVTPASVQARFRSSRGLDAIFRTNDGSVSPVVDVSTVQARRTAYALLLSKGLIRVGLPVPPGADFTLESVDDPYDYASATELSLFRRPLPSTNLAFLSTVMWDGRETFPGQSMRFNLEDQANAATVGHAAGAPLTALVRKNIVDFEIELFTAQTVDDAARSLTASGASGGPQLLARQPFWPGINSAQDPTGAPPTARAFTLFEAWGTANGPFSAARQAIARGQEVFNGRTFTPRRSTCSSCHNAPNAGSSSTAQLFDIGVSAAARRTPDLPLYTFRCTSGQLAGQTRITTDPGLGLITGRCEDIGRFKVPTLRGLAARPPYFHNGAAATLDDVVTFYDQRFGIRLTPGERSDLVAFLRAL